MYLGAISALKDEMDTERLSKAAHRMRELMEKISEIVDVEIRALNERMGQAVAELETEFDSMLGKSKLKPPKWDGEVDQPVQRCLEKLREFFDWKKNHQPRRRDETSAADLHFALSPLKSNPPTKFVREWPSIFPTLLPVQNRDLFVMPHAKALRHLGLVGYVVCVSRPQLAARKNTFRQF
jgi:hypothetical protein